MLNSTGKSDTQVRTLVRGVSRWGTLCGVLAVVMFSTGCPPVVMPRCTIDADCDDGNFCNGVETCVIQNNTGTCEDGAAPCPDGETCNEEADRCENCTTNEDCADDDACNGIETCTDGRCADGTAVDCDDAVACTDDSCDMLTGECTNADNCPDGQVCVAATGECADTCADDAECDDGEFCNGAETCVDGACAAGTDPCPDDGAFCNGTESCDEDGDACVSSGNPCMAGETCNEDTDACDVAPCADDAECDDMLFCNGTETCVDGGCTAGTDPCAANETCNEDTDACDPIAGEMFDFTLGQDSLTGTANADMFTAPLIFNAPTGTSLPSLQTGDSAVGNGGADSLTATFNFTAGATTVSSTLTNIPTITISDLGNQATTLAGATVTGTTRFNFQNSINTNAFNLTNYATLPDIGISNQAVGVNLTLANAATAANNDDMTLALSNVTAGTVAVTSGTTNGVETVNVESNGAMNTLTAFNMTTGTTLTTFNISGMAPLTITNALPNTVTTVNAAMAVGGVNVTIQTAGNVAFTGGDGNDTVVYGATYTNADVIDGGMGTNTLGLTSATAAATTNQTNVTNMGALSISDALANNVVTSRFGTITTVNLAAGFGGANTLTVPTGSTINFAATDGGAVNGTIDVAGLGTTDAATVNLNDHDTGGALIFTGVETLNINSNNNPNGAAADGGNNNIAGALTLTPTFGTGVVNVGGVDHLMLTGVVTAGTINASTYTGNLVMGAVSANAISITSGSGNDTIIGSNAADILNAGSGTNTIRGEQGVDNVTLGAGVDTLRITAINAAGADRKLVTGFTAGAGGDVLSLSMDIGGGGATLLDGSDNFATAASIQNHATAGALVVAAASEVVRVTSATVANLTEANSLNGTNLLTAIGGTITVNANGNQHIFVVADASGNVGAYFCDAGAGNNMIVAAECTLVGVLQTVTIGNLVFSNFANN